MPDIGFRRADGAIARITRTEGFSQRSKLNRIAQRRAGAMGLDIPNRARLNARGGMGLANNFGLRLDGWRGITDFVRAIVVDRIALDDRDNLIAVFNRILQAAQDHKPRPVAKDRARGIRIKRPAMPVRRGHAVRRIEVGALGWIGDRDTPRHGHIRGATPQALTGLRHGHQRGGARTLHGCRRAAQVQFISHTGGNKILIIAK